MIKDKIPVGAGLDAARVNTARQPNTCMHEWKERMDEWTSEWMNAAHLLAVSMAVSGARCDRPVAARDAPGPARPGPAMMPFGRQRTTFKAGQATIHYPCPSHIHLHLAIMLMTCKKKRDRYSISHLRIRRPYVACSRALFFFFSFLFFSFLFFHSFITCVMIST